jgi:hypothetical protein
MKIEERARERDLLKHEKAKESYNLILRALAKNKCDAALDYTASNGKHHKETLDVSVETLLSSLQQMIEAHLAIWHTEPVRYNQTIIDAHKAQLTITAPADGLASLICTLVRGKVDAATGGCNQQYDQFINVVVIAMPVERD